MCLSFFSLSGDCTLAPSNHLYLHILPLYFLFSFLFSVSNILVFLSFESAYFLFVPYTFPTSLPYIFVLSNPSLCILLSSYGFSHSLPNIFISLKKNFFSLSLSLSELFCVLLCVYKGQRENGNTE